MNTSRYVRRPRHRASLRRRIQFPNIRLVTVGTLTCREKVLPLIRLRGQWLQQAGFTPQSVVRVVVTEGQLELTVVSLNPSAGSIPVNRIDSMFK